jgi:hypothetical protein
MKHVAAMVDMAQSKEEIKETMPDAVAESDKAGPIYPYGLCLRLTEKEIGKLNLDTDAAVGDTIHIFALGRVTNTNESEGESGVRKSVELQITQMAVESEDAENEEMDVEEGIKQRKAKESRWYGSKDA